ncbi:MAG TPA: phosphodiesterase [Burkholderiales bacterium]|nr:phosphodiesterase [Burkholderiales bacterium]
MIVCQISDMHLKAGGKLAFGVLDTAAHLKRCIAHILKLPQQPAAVVMTGDLVDGGKPQEYALLREIVAPLSMPVYLIPGNHDEREALRAAFPDHAYLNQFPPFIQYAIEEHAVRIVAIDTVVPGQDGGELCAQRLEWLALTLATAPQRPTLLLMHHPPFATQIAFMDEIGLATADALAQIVSRHPQIERILCGHLHRPIQARFAGTLACTAPSTAHQITLDLAADAPATFMLEPPAYYVHAWTPQTGVVTHTAYVDDFPGPYPFSNI